MTYEAEFVEIPLDHLQREASIMKANGWRFIQTHAVNSDDGVDLYYSFMKDGHVRNYKIEGVKKDQPVQSITNLFLSAFVFENEARELFGVDMRDIAIDFKGAMYAPAESEPMTFISPAQKAAREKATKDASANEKTGVGEGGSSHKTGKRIFIMTPERRARLDAKLATMSAEKVAKVEAALKARAAEAAQAQQGGTGDAEASENADAAAASAAVESAAGEKAAVETPKVDMVLEKAISVMNPDKAAKVRAALARKNGAEISADAEEVAPAHEMPADKQLEEKLSEMDPAKAEKVRAALRDKAARDAAIGGGE